MKKALSIILAIIMIATVLPFSFAAEPETDYEIGYGETISIINQSVVCVKFVPEITSKYIFRTESDGVDTGAYLLDSNGDDIYAEYWDDNEEGYGFILKCKLEAGKVYYLNIYVHHGDSADFDLIVECGHYYRNGVCTVCGNVCEHKLTEDMTYVCECGQNFTGNDISAGVEVEYDCTEHENAWNYYRLIPEESGVYCIESFSDGDESDPWCFVFDEEGDWIAGSDDYGDTLEFRTVCALESGKTYYLEIGNNYEKADFVFKAEKMSHTAEDGSIHNDFTLVEETYSNCTEHGYSEGLYCNECEKFVEGHEEYSLDEWWHIDEDWDGICDLCGKENIYDINCECICHREELFYVIIWRIANFFHSILGIMPECECGELHY